MAQITKPKCKDLCRIWTRKQTKCLVCLGAACAGRWTRHSALAGIPQLLSAAGTETVRQVAAKVRAAVRTAIKQEMKDQHNDRQRDHGQGGSHGCQQPRDQQKDYLRREQRISDPQHLMRRKPFHSVDLLSFAKGSDCSLGSIAPLAARRKAKRRGGAAACALPRGVVS